VIPNDGSASGSGYDAAGNCGLGFQANFNIDVDNWECVYSSDSTTENAACARFTIPDDNADSAGGALAVAKAFLDASSIAYPQNAPVQCVTSGALACPGGFPGFST
jgi:hypothetical protein